MKLPSRVDGSVCGLVLSKRPLASLAAAGLRAGDTGRRLCRGEDASVRQATSPRGAGRYTTSSPSSPSFPSSASSASSASSSRPVTCSRSSQWLISTFLRGLEEHPSSRPPHVRRTARSYSTAAATATKAQKSSSTDPGSSPARDKEHLLSFVDQAEGASVEESFNFHRDPYRRGYAAPDGPKIHVSEKTEEVQHPSHDEIVRLNDKVQVLLGRLCAAIGHKIRHPHRFSLGAIYKLYCELPEPRMLHLTWQWRDRLLKIMGTPHKRNMESMLRYFSLVADVKNAGLTLRRAQWNFALAFATKYVTRVTTQEMESALRLWKEMEHDAKVMGNDVTFNVLFDVAAKAGNFTLADMIYKEMDRRGIEFNRFHHVSLIHYFGLKLDSAGIRAAYREMVESGEMIDTVALNCVISGLLRCGEEAAAEETYRRMKHGHALAPEMPRKDYMTNKVVTKVLMMFTRIGKQHPELKKSFQDSTQLAPDLHTYRLLVNHYAIKLGNLPKIAQFLDEMKHLNIPIDPTIFLALLKGFYMHGGFAGSDWSQQRLDGVLSALYQAHDEHATGFRIDRWLVIWALRAVKKCSTTEALIKTFDEMAQRWDIDPDRQQFMHAIFENILYDKDLKSRAKYDGALWHRKNDGPWP